MALDKIRITGGISLKGDITISGAKNAALPVLAMTLLTDEPCIISNVPNLHDVEAMCGILKALGAEVTTLEPHTLRVHARHISQYEAPYDFVRKMRASVLVLGPLLARFGQARVSLPGGCAIGVRPINLHLKAFEALGAHIELHDGYVEAKAAQLRGTQHFFDTITVTGTINAVVAAALADGSTTFSNCALEPEVVQACEMLVAMGIPIDGIGTHTLTVHGQKRAKGCNIRLISDRVETGTYMVAAAITGGDLRLLGANASHLTAVIEKLREVGATVDPMAEGLHVKGHQPLRPVDIRTIPYPGFPTDMQAQFVSLLALAQGTSNVTETIFENRFMHVPELMRMGANIEIKGPNLTIRGVKELSGAPVMATDLRASASLVLAGLVATGQTDVLRIYHLDRGYERMEEKLRHVGARIERLKETSHARGQNEDNP